VAYVLLAADADRLCTVVAAILPVFVAALAVAAFVNGFWMSVGGYFNMNLADFWQYSFHWMDYQTFSFQLLVKNEFASTLFRCSETNGSCFCSYPSSLQAAGQCAFTGGDVLDSLGYGVSFNYGCLPPLLTLYTERQRGPLGRDSDRHLCDLPACFIRRPRVSSPPLIASPFGYDAKSRARAPPDELYRLMIHMQAICFRA
jgi:hypothetical protein